MNLYPPRTEPTNSHVEMHPLDVLQASGSQSTHQASRLKRYEIIWLKSGSMLLNIDLHPVMIQDSHILCFSPGQVRNLHCGNDTMGYYLSLSPDFFDMLFPDFTSLLAASHQPGFDSPLLLSLQEETDNTIETILVKMQQEFIQYHSLRQEVLKGWLALLLLHVSRMHTSADCTTVLKRDAELARKFMHLVSEGYKKKKMVADYASELIVSPSYLNHVVKKVSGFTASQHIQQFFIMEAKRQAVQSQRSMKEIAYDLGFTDISHFSKFFKNNSGSSFTDFRKKYFSKGTLIRAVASA